MPTGGLESRWIPAANDVCGDKPIIATETGYHNAVNQPEQPGISEQAASKYLLRLLFEYFNRGIERTYSYELLDLQANPQRDYSQYNYGLLHHDGSPKPDFIALKNAIKLLAESDGNIEQARIIGDLDYQIESKKNNIHHTLLQKQNRNFYLILWQEVPSFDLSQRTNIKVAARPLKLNLNTAIATAKVYRPINSTKALKQYVHPKQLIVDVYDDPVIIELSPA